MNSKRSAITTGVMLAALAAIAFGATTPVVAWAGREVGPFSTAALLYFGAAVTGIVLRVAGGRSERPLRRDDIVRLIAVALAGGAVAPTLLAWGLQRAGATMGSLLLNFEAVFTVLLARAVWREPIGPRVSVALLAMVAGGTALTLDAWRDSSWSVAGVIAIVAATAAWALDNTLTRPLSERNPLDVVAAKGGLGALMTCGIAMFAREPRPGMVAATALLACGATGYGLSLRLYLLAQRKIGAARTGSVFAIAPFVGALLSTVLAFRLPGAWTIVSAVVFGVGVWLHATERHAHTHVHEEIEHDHPHDHGDEHHDHGHDGLRVDGHSHRHRHTRLVHEHEHAPDLHHDHRH